MLRGDSFTVVFPATPVRPSRQGIEIVKGSSVVAYEAATARIGSDALRVEWLDLPPDAPHGDALYDAHCAALLAGSWSVARSQPRVVAGERGHECAFRGNPAFIYDYVILEHGGRLYRLVWFAQAGDDDAEFRRMVASFSLDG